MDDSNRPVSGPAGLYGATRPRITGGRVAIALCSAILGLLVGLGAGHDEGGSRVDALPLADPVVSEPTVTQTLTTAGPTVTATRTATASPAPTVTKTKVKTVTKVRTRTVPAAPLVDPGSASVYYDNCTEAREAGDTPLYRGDPGYASHLDRDGDGVACE
ncbi:excalibur calcium-binding domain-containing protein [Phycicoccus endophyticus]|uniref:excalibur calcium-binding domain-containing protein n=1 Tax=Phycicoccus endophyticus TaxID=1690220 RepID=UPI001E2D88F5|nr:excalibur calcium-binding domain-containing protein [Phycicoccus endophyticus]